MDKTIKNALLRLWFCQTLLFGFCCAQSCVKVDQIEKVVPLCARYLNETSQNGTFLLPKGPTQWIITSILSQAGFSASGSIAFTETKCQKAMMPYVCRSVFKPCSVDGGEAFGRPQCHSVCEGVVKACSATLNPANLPNCTTFQRGTWVNATTSSGRTVLTKCVKPSELNHAEFPFECPYPMVNFVKGKEPNKPWPFPWPCGLRCPGWINQDNLEDYNTYWGRIFLFGRITGTIITSLDFLTLVLMAWHWRYWITYPINMIALLKILMSFSQLSLTIPAWGPFAFVGCKSEYEAHDSYNFWCAITGILTGLIFSFILNCALLIFNITLGLFFPYNDKIKLFFKIASPIIIVVPQLIIIPWAIATNVYAGDYNCFILSETPLAIILGHWEVVLLMGFATTFLLVGFMIKNDRSDLYKKLRRIVLFGFVFESIFLVSTTLGIRNLIIAPAIKADATQFLTCVIGNFVASVNPAHGLLPQCVQEAPALLFARVRFYLISSNFLITISIIGFFWPELFDKKGKLKNLAKLVKSKLTTSHQGSSQPSQHSSSNTPPSHTGVERSRSH